MEGDVVNKITVNAKKTLILLGTSKGFRVYDFERVQLCADRQLGAGIGPIDVLEMSNILVMSGAGPYPYIPTHKIIVWDDHEQTVRAEVVFKSEVKNVRVKYDYLFVALENKIYAYSLFEQLTLMTEYTTFSNPNGLLPTNAVDVPTKLAYIHDSLPPDATRGGCVQIVSLEDKRTVALFAHTSPVRCMDFNLQGNLFATASERGTLVRLFDTDKGIRLKEFRRGLESSTIHSLDFNFFDQVLGCVSDSGTLHIWALEYAYKAHDRGEEWLVFGVVWLFR